MTLRVGIIGLGRIAWGYDSGRWDGTAPALTHASCFGRHPETELAAAYDPVVEARAAFRAGYAGSAQVALHDGLEGFLAENLDLVAIASPSEHHAVHIAACLDANVPRLWIEKPVTLKLDDYSQLLDRIQSMPQPPRTCVNYPRRALPQLAQMKRHLAASATRPENISIEVSYSRQLAVNGVHMLDLLSALTGATEVPPLDYLRKGPNGNPQFGFSLSGHPVTVTGHDLPYHLIELSITDDRGRLSLVRGGRDLVWEKAVPNPGYPGFFHLAPPEGLKGVEDGETAMNQSMYRMLCSLTDPQAPELSTFESAWFAQALLESVSAKSGLAA